MRIARSRRLVTFVGAIVTMVGCDDPTQPPAPGSIHVVVQASGEDVILDGTRVVVANGPTRQLGGSSELTIVGLPPGIHAVRLDGLAVNCQVTSPNPRSVTVVSNGTAVAEFIIQCAPRVGSIRVTAATTGTELDPDGYMAVVIGGPSHPVPVNGTATVANVREGQRMVTLTDVAPNCTIAGVDTTTVTVQLGTTADVVFSIQCQGSGSLKVTVSTTGGDPDPNGYAVAVQATSVSFSGTLAIAPNGSVTFSRLSAAADYRVRLQAVAANCDLVGADAQTVTVTAGGTTNVAFEVSCLPPAPLAFVRDGDIYVIASNGTGATRLTTDPAFDGDPAWSSTGQIAFTTTRHAGDLELYVMNADGTNPVRITTSAGADDAPSWSPDGQRIVFRSFRDVNSEIYVVNANGSGLTRITNNDVEDVQPAWSSTGKIAFVSNRDHSAGEIYVMNEDGSNVVRLTNNDAAEISPAWSPDASMIAFARSGEIFVINANGSNERRLATGDGTNLQNGDPSWSPNGHAIAFMQVQVEDCGWYYCDPPSVWIVDLDGTELALITNNGTNPAWRP